MRFPEISIVHKPRIIFAISAVFIGMCRENPALQAGMNQHEMK